MTPESRNSSLLGNGTVNTFPRMQTCTRIEEQCLSVVRAALVATQRCSTCKYISAAVNQHATIEEAVFSVEVDY
jgi:hypothetical protein